MVQVDCELGKLKMLAEGFKDRERDLVDALEAAHADLDRCRDAARADVAAAKARADAAVARYDRETAALTKQIQTNATRGARPRARTPDAERRFFFIFFFRRGVVRRGPRARPNRGAPVPPSARTGGAPTERAATDAGWKEQALLNESRAKFEEAAARYEEESGAYKAAAARVESGPVQPFLAGASLGVLSFAAGLCSILFFSAWGHLREGDTRAAH